MSVEEAGQRYLLAHWRRLASELRRTGAQLRDLWQSAAVRAWVEQQQAAKAALRAAEEQLALEQKKAQLGFSPVSYLQPFRGAL